MFLDVVDDHALGPDGRVVFQGIQGEPGAFEFVFEVWGVDEDELVVARGEVDVHFEHFEFVAAVLVKADLPMPRTFGLSMNSGIIASTSLARPMSSDSFGLMQSQQKCAMPYFAARLGSYSVSCRK